MGSATGSLAFVTVYNTLTMQLYCKTGPYKTDNQRIQQMQDWDFRKKNFLIYLTADFTSCCTRIIFEARKYLIQMCNTDTPLN